MTAYYNENNPRAAAMLRQLIKDGVIARGLVDDRSIEEVTPDDLIGFSQHHFFAGIGGWSIALRLAGWPDDKQVWTGSCPCQPFSTAGKQKGKSDDRHLWPIWFKLISQCRPGFVFGEQVSSAITHGWWDEVATDLEAEGYACGAAVLPACSVGAPHRRDRLWFVGHAQHDGRDGATVGGSDPTAICDNAQGQDGTVEPAGTGAIDDVANPQVIRSDGRNRYWHRCPWGQGQGEVRANDCIGQLECPDGKTRIIEPSIRLLADGLPTHRPVLHALGNAIVPHVAAQFIKAAS
jgi:DNA (cytosine-5)-methyltransferase 1